MDHEEAKKAIYDSGQTVAQFAKQHGFPVSMVRKVLAKKLKGNRGRAYLILIALGIEQGPADPARLPKGRTRQTLTGPCP